MLGASGAGRSRITPADVRAKAALAAAGPTPARGTKLASSPPAPAEAAKAAEGEEVKAWLESIGQEEWFGALLAGGLVSLALVQRQGSDAQLKQLGLPLGPRKKITAELHKRRMKELLSEAKREEIYFEQNFPEGSEARKMFGQGTAF